ncbi:MAG: hypothetical protein AB7T14_02605 [Candidatus Methylacidiphilaceae bacterium]
MTAATAGLPARIGSTLPPRLPRNPERLSPSELRRTIRAEIIRWPFLNRYARGFLTNRGIEIDGARIWGPVYLSNLRIPFPLRFRRCFLQYPVNLLHLTIPELSFAGYAVSAIYGESLTVADAVDLRTLDSVPAPPPSTASSQLPRYRRRFAPPHPPIRTEGPARAGRSAVGQRLFARNGGARNGRAGHLAGQNAGKLPRERLPQTKEQKQRLQASFSNPLINLSAAKAMRFPAVCYSHIQIA